MEALSDDLFSQYDPSSVGIKGNLFGLPYDENNAKIVILPVPWEVTVTSGNGTSKGPDAILEESTQLDLSLVGYHKPWLCTPFMLPFPARWKKENDALKPKSQAYIQWLEQGSPIQKNEVKKIQKNEKEGEGNEDKEELTVNASSENADNMEKNLLLINLMCKELNHWVKKQSLIQLNKGKKVGVLGGEHSCCYGLIDALRTKHQDFGILQIDAHSDLRPAYGNFIYSHASIMYNILKWSEISKLVQVGVRDVAESELKMIEKNPQRITTFFDSELKKEQFQNISWQAQCEKILSTLPQKVYISFDIDGLTPENCPHTGTPVPGGLTYDMAFYLIEQLHKSGRSIIGFDLSEVSPNPSTRINQIVGNRVLYYLSVFSNEKVNL